MRTLNPMLIPRVQLPRIMPRFGSVRGRLLLLILALALPGTAIVAVLTGESYHSQQQAVRAEMVNTARAVASIVDAELDRSAAVLRTITATAALQRGDWAGVDALARRIMPDQGRWLVVTDLSGAVLVNTHVPRGEPIPRLDLRADFLASMRSDHRFVSNLVYGPAARQNVVYLGLPFELEGRALGISIVMDPRALGDALDVQRFSPGGVISILDRTGRIIARYPSGQEFAGRLATPDVVAATTTHREGMGESVTLEKIPVLMAFSHTASGWSVALGTPKERVFATAQRLFLLAMASSLAVTLGAIFLAAWLARAVVRNADELAATAEQLARGEEPPLREGQLEEFQTVARAMQAMAMTKNQAQAELRDARDRLQQHADELEKKVGERTASLREAVAQMEEFSYTVSHDLRAPIRAIQGYTSVLLEDRVLQADTEATEFLQRILRAGERMNRLTSAMLSYSRVAKTDLKPEPVALEPMLRGTIEQYPELHPSAAEVRLITPMPHVLAHEISLTQALTNLLTNAAKFVKPGHRPIITVRASRHGDRVRVWVEDNGIGVPEAHRERLFRIFERAPGTASYEGTGVGLAIVRKVMEKNGGACGVESDGQTGSQFWIELPAA